MLIASMLACAASALPAAAAERAPTLSGGTPASAAGHASKRAPGRSSTGKRGACGGSSTSHARAGRKANCRPSPVRTNSRTPQRRRQPAVAKPENTTRSSQVAAAQAATIAQVLATPCQNINLTPTSANLALVRAAVLCLINNERAQHGEDPLQSNRQLEAAAESHGREMIAVNYFDHVSPAGMTPVDRVREAGYFPDPEVGYVVGENLAWGTLTLSTPEAIVNAWIASPEHLANILEANYRDTGIDVEPEVPKSLADGVEGGLYTQEFGVIVN
jgi:uncharacterized protein YkwD